MRAVLGPRLQSSSLTGLIGISVGAGFKGIGVGLGGGDVLVGPSFAALIVGTGVCGAEGCEGGEHADEHNSRMLHKIHMIFISCRIP